MFKTYIDKLNCIDRISPKFASMYGFKVQILATLKQILIQSLKKIKKKHSLTSNIHMYINSYEATTHTQRKMTLL